MKRTITEFSKNDEADLLLNWQHLHSIPEKSSGEVKTSRYLADKLKEYGYEVETFENGTGIIGVLEGKESGPTIGLRAEMDALSYDIDGQTEYFHNCGHDANCSIMLSVAKVIQSCNLLKKGKIKIIFQSAEETFKGARELINTNRLNDLDYLIGVHLRSKDELTLGKAAPCVIHGASAHLKINIKGKSAHAARPEMGINAIEIASSLINQIKKDLVIQTNVPYSSKATNIRGGGPSFNVIPANVEIIYDFRAQDNDLMAKLKNEVFKIISNFNLEEGAAIDFEWSNGGYAAKYDKMMAAIASNNIVEVLGAKNLVPPLKTPGAEDFHEYAIAIPKLKSTILGIGADLVPGLHQFGMKFDKDALLIGAKIISFMVYDLLNKDYQSN